MTRSEILRTAEKYVTKDRNATHGEPEDSFLPIARYWTAYFLNRGDTIKPLTPVDVAQLMSLFKKGRFHTNPANVENFTDDVGYTSCCGELATTKTP